MAAHYSSTARRTLPVKVALLVILLAAGPAGAQGNGPNPASGQAGAPIGLPVGGIGPSNPLPSPVSASRTDLLSRTSIGLGEMLMPIPGNREVHFRLTVQGREPSPPLDPALADPTISPAAPLFNVDVNALVHRR